MERPLRIEYPGALYHVINRGHRKDKIFRRTADREVFLGKLIAARRIYLYLLKRRTGLTLAEIGRLTGTSAPAVATLTSTFEKKAKKDAEIRKQIEKVEKALDGKVIKI